MCRCVCGRDTFPLSDPLGSVYCVNARSLTTAATFTYTHTHTQTHTHTRLDNPDTLYLPFSHVGGCGTLVVCVCLIECVCVCVVFLEGMKRDMMLVLPTTRVKEEQQRVKLTLWLFRKYFIRRDPLCRGQKVINISMNKFIFGIYNQIFEIIFNISWYSLGQSWHTRCYDLHVYGADNINMWLAVTRIH